MKAGINGGMSETNDVEGFIIILRSSKGSRIGGQRERNLMEQLRFVELKASLHIQKGDLLLKEVPNANTAIIL